MGLLVKRAGREEYGHQIKILIGGHPGAGKTRFSSTAPGVLWAATGDAGLMSVVDRQCPYVEIESSQDVDQLLKVLQQVKGTQEKFLGFVPQTVVLDTVDGIQRLLIEERLKETKRDQLTVQDFGWLGDQLRGIVRAFRNLPIHTIFTVHLKTVEDQDTGRTTTKPALQGAMADELAAYVDLACVLRANPKTAMVNGESRKVLIRTAQFAPDNNMPWLKDRSGQLGIEFDVNLNDDFDRIFRSIFGNEASIPASETIAEVADEPKSPKASTTRKSTSKAAAEEPKPEPTLGFSDAPEATDSPAVAEAPQAEAATPVVTEPEAAAAPVAEPEAAEESVPDPEPVPAPAAEAPEASTEEEQMPPCSNCGGQIENLNQLDLSQMRFRVPLCRVCFVERKKK